MHIFQCVHFAAGASSCIVCPSGTYSRVQGGTPKRERVSEPSKVTSEIRLNSDTVTVSVLVCVPAPRGMGTQAIEDFV
jgi:hypothetical protein